MPYLQTQHPRSPLPCLRKLGGQSRHRTRPRKPASRSRDLYSPFSARVSDFPFLAPSPHSIPSPALKYAIFNVSAPPSVTATCVSRVVCVTGFGGRARVRGGARGKGRFSPHGTALLRLYDIRGRCAWNAGESVAQLDYRGESKKVKKVKKRRTGRRLTIRGG